MVCWPDVNPAEDTTIIFTPDGVVIVFKGVPAERGRTVLATIK